MYSDADATVMLGQTSVQIVPHRWMIGAKGLELFSHRTPRKRGNHVEGTSGSSKEAVGTSGKCCRREHYV